MKFRPYDPEILDTCQSYIDAEAMPIPVKQLLLKTWLKFATLACEVGLSPYKVFDILDGYSA